jgi:hypothetical protein
MDVFIIERTENCLHHAFNGTLIAKEGEQYTHSVESLCDAKLLNVYRNSEEPKSPCNISGKFIKCDGQLDRQIDGQTCFDIFQNECNEDPRVFVYNSNLYISYNKVEFEDENYATIKNVSVVYRKLIKTLDKTLAADPDELTFPIAKLNKWEKNWCFFGHNGVLHIAYSLYPLVIYDNTGTCVKRRDWSHPYDICKRYQHNPRISMNMDINVLKSFRSANELFKYQQYEFDIRGGTPFVKHDNKYYAFAHTREMPHAQYNMIVIVLNDNMDLWGFTEPFENDGHRIMYPMGAVMVRDELTWYISCGLNDVDQVIVKLPHELLLQKIIYFDVTKHGTP